MTKEDLKDDDVLIYRDGRKRTLKGGSLFRAKVIANNSLSQYNDDLTHYVNLSPLDIVEVIRDGQSIWKRGETYGKREEGFKPNQLKELLSKQEHDNIRIKAIAKAVILYVDAGEKIPEDWVDELANLI